MSIRLMSAVFDSQTLAPGERLVMLALADHADEEGRCYPSVARLCQRTGMSQRTVQGHIKRLSETGYLTVIPNAGRSLANLYIVRATPAETAGVDRAEAHPRKNCTPAESAPKPPQKTTRTPAESAPKPLEPSLNHSGGGSAGEDQTFLERVCAAAGKPMGQSDARGRLYLPSPSVKAKIDGWVRDLGLTQDQVVAEVDRLTRTKRGGPPHTFNYFDDPLARLAGELQAAARSPLTPIPPTGEPRHDRQHRPYTDRRQAATDAAFADRIATASRARSS